MTLKDMLWMAVNFALVGWVLGVLTLVMRWLKS